MTARQRSVKLLGAFVLALLYPGAASAQGPGPFCGVNNVTENCILTITVDGGTPSPSITAALANNATSGVYTIQFLNTGNQTNPVELAPTLTTNNVLSVTFRLAIHSATDPRLAVSTGLVSSWTVNTVPTPHEVTFTAKPRATSWSNPSCTPNNCPTQATVDFQALLLAAFDPISTANRSSDFVYFATKYSSAFTATNGQFCSPIPTYNATTKGISFIVGSPHLTKAGPQNTGFARLFIPEAVITDPAIWNIPGGSAAMAANNNLATVTVGGLQADFTIVAVTAGNTPLGALVEIGETNPFGYSTPEVLVKPAAAAVFTDDPLVAGTTVIKGVHITELRSRIDTQRQRFGLAAFPYTDPTIAAATTVVKAAHVTELRTALSQAYVAHGMSAPTFTDSVLTVGTTVVKAVHISELRSALLTLEGS